MLRQFLADKEHSKHLKSVKDARDPMASGGVDRISSSCRNSIIYSIVSCRWVYIRAVSPLRSVVWHKDKENRRCCRLLHNLVNSNHGMLLILSSSSHFMIQIYQEAIGILKHGLTSVAKKKRWVWTRLGIQSFGNLGLWLKENSRLVLEWMCYVDQSGASSGHNVYIE